MNGYPVDGDRHDMKYRADIFDNAEMQAKFKTETGKDLRVPQTWEEYNAVAKFFSGWDWRATASRISAAPKSPSVTI